MRDQQPIVPRGITPMCGYPWIWQHQHDLDNWKPTLEISRPGGKYTIATQNTEALNKAIKEITK